MKRSRVLAVLLSLCLLLGTVQVRVGAQEELAQIIIESCYYNDKVDISEYKLNQQELNDLFAKLYHAGELPWYTDMNYTCYYDSETELVLEFQPTLLDDTQWDRVKFEQVATEAYAESVFPNMTQEQIALSLHDWLVDNCVYDETLEKNTAYDLFVNGTTVCAGYAQAYRELLGRAGIESVIVTSDAMEHAWNLVKIDGQWYHVDVTWDDPTPNRYGYVGHNYFLLTDEEISAGDEPHHGWETDITCTDTRFTDGYWRDITARICFDSFAGCYLLRTEDWDNQLIYRSKDGSEKVIYTDKADYVDIGKGQYGYTHGGLNLWNDRLYINTMSTLLSMDKEGGNQKVEYAHSLKGNYLFAGSVKNNVYYATLSDHDGNATSKEITLPPTNYHTHSYTSTVTEANCSQPGYTQCQCQCGITFQTNHAAPADHDYKQTEGKKASLFHAGYSNEVCQSCGDEVFRELPRLTILDLLRRFLSIFGL